MTPNKKRLYVQLGRAGDILNVLPLLEREYHAKGERPMLMISRSFASILDGISYVEPIVWPGQFDIIVPALQEADRIAREEGADVMCTQIYGRGLISLEQCTSFMRESWARVPDAPAWGSLPLTFDRRDRAIEASVKAQLLRGHVGRYVVVALSGTSSPFEHGPELVSALKRRLTPAGVKVVDISGFIAPRFFDLLGVLEGAQSLVAIDSGILHLAHAVPSLPVVALITREPSRWHGSAYRPQHIARYYYDEAPEIIPGIVEAAARPQRRPEVVHVWTEHDGNIPDDTRRRIAFAKSTWASAEFATWKAAPYCSTMGRTSANIGDPRPVPYLRDMIAYAIERAHDETSIIAFTNADSCLTPGVAGLVYDATRAYGAAFAHRYDFGRPIGRPLVNETQVRRGSWYPGSDGFFFTVKWWRKYGTEMPDVLVGREHVDEVFRQLIKRHGGVALPAAIYHEKHASYWDRPLIRELNQGNRHNRKLAQRWFLRNGYAPDDPVWWRLPGA